MIFLEGELVQWLDGTACKTGRILEIQVPVHNQDLLKRNHLVITDSGIQPKHHLNKFSQVLVKHSYDGLLQFISQGCLSPYPSSKIPVP